MFTDSTVPTTVLVNQSVPVSVTVTTSADLAGLSCLASGVDLSADPTNTTCAAIVAANTPCAYVFTFKATTPGPKNDSILCSGDGVVKTMPVAPTVVTGEGGSISGPNDLGSVEVGSAGTPSIYSIANSGGTATGVLTIAAGDAQFTIGNDRCTGLPLAPAKTCTFTVVFGPASVGVQSSVLSVSSGGTVLATLQIQGIGVPPAPVLAASPGLVDFGTVALGEVSPVGVVTVTNKGTPVSLFPTVTGSGFLLDSTTCGMAAASCTVAVKFSPKSVGAASGVLTVAPGLTVSLSGVGTAPSKPTSLVITPNLGAFSAAVGSPSPPITFNVANTGGSATGALTITLGGVNAADFAITDNKCVGSLAPLTTCAIQVVFKPASAGGSKTATLTVTDAIAGSIPAIANLSGFGSSPPAVVIAGAANLGVVPVGQAGTPSTYTVTNTGGIATGALTVAVDSDQFVIGDDQCTGLPLAPGNTCTFTIAFCPTSSGAESAGLSVSFGETSPLTLPIQGTGLLMSRLGLVMTPPTLDFGTVSVGSASSALTFTVTNADYATTGVLSVVKNDGSFSVGGASQFSYTTTCQAALAPAASCQVVVTFTPTIAGSASATFTVTDGTISTRGQRTVVGIGV
jgi:hypothetical protein